MNLEAIDTWEKKFRKDALEDNLTIFREHLRRLELPDEPELLLDGTIKLVRLCAGYCSLDNRDSEFNDFLAAQTYDPAKSIKAKYAYTFKIHTKAYARVFVEFTKDPLDLADIYGSPWHEYQVCGFDLLWISHLDWSPLSKDEAIEIEREVTEDILYDYSEEELNYWCDSSMFEEFVLVNIQDACED